MKMSATVKVKEITITLTEKEAMDLRDHFANEVRHWDDPDDVTDKLYDQLVEIVGVAE